MTTFEKQRLQTAAVTQIGLIVLLVLLLVGTAFGQTEISTTEAAAQTAENTVLQPLLTDYKSIKIGMTADEVRDKLGKPKIGDETGFYYEFSNDETANIVLDADKKVRVIAVTYRDKASAPAYADVFGANAAVAAQPDGRIYNLVRYPASGFWIAYSQSAGDDPVVTVTIQKMRETTVSANK